MYESKKANESEVTVKDDVSGIKSLGSGETEYANETGVNPALLERFPNKFPQREYTIRFQTREFTSTCPKTGQPDFGNITVEYVPDEWCVESKGLKLYLGSYRSEGTFMETLTNRILTDLVELVKPRIMTVVGDFAPRGGIGIRVVVRYSRDAGVRVEKSEVETQE